MLVLQRRVNESIVIDGRIEVMVVDIRGDKVRLGIIAPDDMVIDRKEVHLDKLREKKAGRKI